VRIVLDDCAHHHRRWGDADSGRHVQVEFVSGASDAANRACGQKNCGYDESVYESLHARVTVQDWYHRLR
jgi:hypothetical protein